MYCLLKMISLFIATFAALWVVSASPVPSSSDELSIAANTADITDDSALAFNSNYNAVAGCSGDNPTINLSDDNIENTQAATIVERSALSCPATGLRIPWRNPLIKVPSDGQNPQPATLPNPTSPPTGPGEPENPCTIPAQQVILSCSGPEIWYRNQLDLVVNCVDGKLCHSSFFNTTPSTDDLGIKTFIQARGRFGRKETLASYCCSEYRNVVSFSFLW